MEFGAQVAVTKITDGEFASHEGSEQAMFNVLKRIEAGAVSAIVEMAPAQVIQMKDGLAFEFGLRQVFEVARWSRALFLLFNCRVS